MRTLFVFGMLFLLPQTQPQTVRDYYNEIYKAGGLDRMADGEVCFDDDPKLDTFFIFGQSKHMREFMLMDGTFAKLSKPMQAAKIAPPTFLIFTNQKEPLHFSYQRFLENQLRAKYDFVGTPVRFIQRLRKRDKRSSGGDADRD
jgi:hypothetical protein